ncbi:cryptochrome/photolyase family protein [Streptomyces sp. NPDC020681]|uniref:cryptochrome/photolyase family protein n=1 Tax=Streptomyces sp. NPDC020681 TaxID=3365083 RepID=UPI00378FB37F
MSVAVMLFTSDLRVHDQPALRAAVRGSDAVVPLFVLDRGVHRVGFDVPNRRAFLADSLASLDAGLRERGGRLVVRVGDVSEQVCRIVVETGAREVHVAAGVSAYAKSREEQLRTALKAYRCALVVHDGVNTALPPGQMKPAEGDHFAAFTPYFLQWEAAGPRGPVTAPREIRVPELAGHPLPRRTSVADVSPGVAKGGEREGRQRLSAWLGDEGSGVEAYEMRRDDLSGDATSGLSPHLHFGTLSAAEVVRRARLKGGPGAAAFVRQLALRDFHQQVLAARPDAARADYRAHGDHWRNDESEIAAWKEGRTGCPIVDAAMRQLRYEGWMPGTGRLLAAGFLTRTLYVDWRVGARHFLELLVDGDIASNQLNWQWAAGTGPDARPDGGLDPFAQARRFDPHGDYVRRWVPELAELAGPDIHEPWKLGDPERAALDYPDPPVDPAAGQSRFELGRGLDRASC